MARGGISKLIQEAKQLLIADPNWYKSFQDNSNTLDGVVTQASNNRKTGPRLNNEDLYNSAAVLARLSLTSRWLGPTKRLDLSVAADPAQKVNRKTFSSATQRALQTFVNKIDWQNDPDSPIKVALNTLAQTVRASGGKADVVPVNKQGTKANATVRRGELAGKITGRPAAQFDLSLLALLNSRLPPAVKANMGEGRALVNRTGLFAQSARVIGIERTPQGFPRLIYTYQRAPYDVFDPVLGSPPWATPGRDPKMLIERSIRDVARDMAIGRFYTRRA